MPLKKQPINDNGQLSLSRKSLAQQSSREEIQGVNDNAVKSSTILYYKSFNDHDLNSKSNLRAKFNEIIEDLEENGCSNLGDIKLIRGGRGIKCFRAKLSKGDRLLFISTNHNGQNVFVILEIILNHDYHKSKFLKGEVKTIEMIDQISNQGNNEVSGNGNNEVEIRDDSQVRWLGKFVTFNAKQEYVVKRVEECRLPLVISGAAGSGKTSVALESLKKIQENISLVDGDGGKVLYITKSENLIKESRKLLEFEHYDDTTGELKTYVPKEIDFLSTHEFFEKLREEDVKGKKPINRSRFFSWFNKICTRDKFKKYKNDRDKIFGEFIAVIGGDNLLEKNGKSQYVSLGIRKSIFPKKERKEIYDFFEEYRNFVENDTEYYDPNLIASKITEQELHNIQAQGYDAIVVDEVQDFIKSTLNLILKSLKNESKNNFLLCGDVNQVIHPSFFSLSRLKFFLRQNGYIENQESEIFYNLEKNYRNSEQVVELANRVLHLKNYCFASEDKITTNEFFFTQSDTNNLGNVSFVAENKEQKKIAEKASKSVNWAVLVLNDENKEKARKLFNTPLVFNIHEVKGLEFENVNVVLYKFMSDRAYNEICSIINSDKDTESSIKTIRSSYDNNDVNTSRSKKKDDFFYKYKFYMNALYVAVSRAMNSVYIFDDEKKYNLLQVIKPEKAIDINIESIKGEASSVEEWRKEALKLIDEGNLEQAKNIAETKLNKEYYKEIMTALQQPQKFLNNSKEKASSKNSTKYIDYPRNPITSATGAIQKHQGKQQPNMRNKKNRRIDKELIAAVKSGNFDKVEGLLNKGADVNCEDSDGNTPLYCLAIQGYGEDTIENIGKLLISYGADVNFANKKKKGVTSLIYAVHSVNKPMVKFLLKNKADANCEDEEGNTPFVYLSLKNYDDIVEDIGELLLEYGANINLADKKLKGSNPLISNALENRNKFMIEFLLKNGVNNVDFYVLNCAILKGYTDIFKLLLEVVDNFDSNFYLSSALEVGNKTGNYEIFDILLNNSDVDVGYIKLLDIKNQEYKVKFAEKMRLDLTLHKKVKLALSKEIQNDEGKIKKLLEEIRELLKPESKYGFKPSLHYSPDGGGKSIIIILRFMAKNFKVINGDLVNLLYDYVKEHVSENTQIFRLFQMIKQTYDGYTQDKEQQNNSYPESDLENVSFDTDEKKLSK